MHWLLQQGDDANFWMWVHDGTMLKTWQCKYSAMKIGTSSINTRLSHPQDMSFKTAPL
jgi:hypothetical protein